MCLGVLLPIPACLYVVLRVRVCRCVSMRVCALLCAFCVFARVCASLYILYTCVVHTHGLGAGRSVCNDDSRYELSFN